MKKLLLFIAAFMLAASAAFAQYPVPDIEPVVPDIDPVPDGITVAVHIPDGTDCYGAPLWGGDTNPIPWNGEEMVAVEGAEGWYKVDINAAYAQGKPLAHPEGWTPEQGLGDWPTQFNDYEIMSKSTVAYEIVGFDDIVLSGTGILYIWVNTWQDNPCVPDRNFTFYIQVPECTPAGQETVNVVGSFPDADGDEWANGIDFPIVDGKATITINGKETDQWKVRLNYEWAQQAVECRDGQIDIWPNKTLGEAEGQVIVVEGWGEVYAIGDCLKDCKPLILSTNNFNLYPGESVKVSLEYKDSPVDASAAVWISNDPEVFTIDETGLITGVAIGQGTFTVTYDDLSATGYVKVLDEALLDITVPDIEPVPDGITIAVYVPEGIDNYRAPLWTGNTNPIPWAGEEMVAVEGAEGWYKVDINATSVQGIPLCQPEGWTEEKGINYWQSAKTRDCRILQSSNISYFNGDFLVVNGTGLVALQVKSWPAVPYEPKRDFTFYVQVPECTPEIQESINIAGSMPGDDGNLWLEGTTFPIVDGVATVTISGFETDEWKVRLTDDWSQQAVGCSNGRIYEWDNQVLGEAEGQVIVVEGWGKAGSAIGDCFSDCKPLILSTNNFILYPGESVKVSLEYKDSPVDASAAVWISNDPEVFTIDETGLITGVATGQGTFTVTYDGLSATGYVKVLDDALLDITVPDIDPVPDGITVAVHIPDGSDCYGAPLWGGDTNPIPWNGEEMVAVEGAEGWYKVDINATSAQGKPLAHPEGWTPEQGLGNWPTQFNDYEIMSKSTVTYEIVGLDDIVLSGTGILYICVYTWQDNPCVPDRNFTFYIQVPECTPEGQETVNVVGSFPDADGYEWAKGIEFPIVDGKATITINGKETDEWNVRLTDDWSQQAVECRDGQIDIWPNKTLGEAEGQVIVVEGWGEVYAIGDCLKDCKPLILSTNNFNLYPGESVKVSLEYKDSPVDASAAVWINNDPEVFTIDEYGLITGVAAGQGTFTVTYNGLSATGYVKVFDDPLLDIPVPDIEPVPDGITIAVHIPNGTDCYGAPLWGGDSNDWSGEEMVAVEGADGWYKVDINATSAQGKPLAHPEGWTPEQGLGNWPTQYMDYEIISKSTAWYEINADGNVVVSSAGVVYIWVKTWRTNPCVENRDFTFYIQVPECTPEGTTHIKVTGSFEAEDGSTWAAGNSYEIVDGVATVTINGQETNEWIVRLTDDWSQQAVECRDGQIDVWNIQTLGAVEGQVIVVEGWGTLGSAIGDCLSDCGTEVVELSRTSAIIEEGSTLPITATSDGNDVTAAATWTSSDDKVAKVEDGLITGVSEGSATITCSYNGATATCAIQVIKGASTGGLKDGSDYYIFQMDETTFNELNQAGKVTSDMRTNGAFEGEVLIPEDATRVNYFWNPAAEVAEAPQSGVNSFGLPESWFSVAAASPTPDGCWGNICGGLGIASATDTEIGKLQNLTPDHVLVVVLKGSYTPATSLQISMMPPSGGDVVTLFTVTDATGEYNDGDWEVFTITYPELIYMGIDLSQPITAKYWDAWAYTANGAGNRVDVDAVFFYVPGEMSAIDETGASSGKVSVSASNGRIYCDEPFRVINLAGQDVTSLNGNLQGTYLVVSGNEAVKVNVN